MSILTTLNQLIQSIPSEASGAPLNPPQIATVISALNDMEISHATRRGLNFVNGEGMEENHNCLKFETMPPQMPDAESRNKIYAALKDLEEAMKTANKLKADQRASSLSNSLKAETALQSDDQKFGWGWIHGIVRAIIMFEITQQETSATYVKNAIAAAAVPLAPAASANEVGFQLSESLGIKSENKRDMMELGRLVEVTSALLIGGPLVSPANDHQAADFVAMMITIIRAPEADSLGIRGNSDIPFFSEDLFNMIRKRKEVKSWRKMMGTVDGDRVHTVFNDCVSPRATSVVSGFVRGIMAHIIILAAILTRVKEFDTAELEHPYICYWTLLVTSEVPKIKEIRKGDLKDVTKYLNEDWSAELWAMSKDVSENDDMFINKEVRHRFLDASAGSHAPSSPNKRSRLSDMDGDHHDSLSADAKLKQKPYVHSDTATHCCYGCGVVRAGHSKEKCFFKDFWKVYYFASAPVNIDKLSLGKLPEYLTLRKKR